MMAEPGCCQGCVPEQSVGRGRGLRRPAAEARQRRAAAHRHLACLVRSDGWRYQLRGAEVKPGVTRRALMAASPLFCLPVPAMAQAADGMAVDIHSHAGNP